MDHFVEKLSARVDATVSDLKTSLHQHVDLTVDRRLDTFKFELASLVRSGVVECIRAQGSNQHWRVETTYTPVSAHFQPTSGEISLVARHSTSFIQGIPPPLLTEDQETSSSCMPTTDQCIADLTFPSGHSMSIPLNDTAAPNQDISDQLPPSNVSSLSPNTYLNNTEQNSSFQSAQTINNEQQIKQEALDDSLATPIDQFVLNGSPPPSPNQQYIKSEDNDSEFYLHRECLNDTLIANQSESGDQLNSTDNRNEPNNQSQVVGANIEQPILNGNILSDDENDDNGEGSIEGESTEAMSLVDVNHLMMTASTSDGIGAQSSSIIQIPSRNSAFRTVQSSVDMDESGTSEDESDSNQNGELATTVQSKRKPVSSKDQSITSKKAKHIDDNESDGNDIKTIYLNCTELECNDQLKTIEELRQHITTKHGLPPFKCYARGCNFCYNDSRYVTHFLDQHTDATEFVCPICAKQFVKQKYANHHVYMIHDTGEFQCNMVDECKLVGATREEIKTHLQRCNNHRVSTRLHCDRCSHTFASQTKLDAHYIRHTRFNPFRCIWPDCDYQTNVRPTIISHIRMVHFGIPSSVKQQLAMNIVEHRDPAHYFEEVTEQED